MLLIILACFSVYFNALYNGFVYDDELIVLENPWIKDVRHLPDIFSKSMWDFKSGIATNYYRPLIHVIFMLNYYLLGLAPWSFHLVNILFHIGNTLLIFIIGIKIFEGTPTAASDRSSAFLSIPFISALLFATHPIHTEAVVWISGISDLSYTFFVLLSFNFFLKSESNTGKRPYLFSVISFFCALLCKETAVMLIAILITYDFALEKKKENFMVRVKKYMPFLLTLGVYFIIRHYALGRFTSEKTDIHISVTQYILSTVHFFGQYLYKLILPIDLNAFYPVTSTISVMDIKWLFALAAVISYIVIGVIAISKNRTLFFGLSAIAIPLIIPVFLFPSITGAQFAERYLYLPSAGFVLLVSALFVRLREKHQQYGFALIAAIIVLVTLYSFQTVTRNRVWKDMIVLCTDIIKKSPDAELPRGNLGNALLDAGRVDEAIEQFQVIISNINPNSETAYYNLGRSLKKKGAVTEAITAFQKATSLNQNDLDAHQLLAISYAEAGMMDDALREYSTLMKWEPDSPLTFTKFGNELEKEGLADKAIEQYKNALALNADFAAAHYYLALAYQKSGELDQALEHLKASVKLQPNEPQLQNSLGIAYAQKGLYDLAAEHFELAVKLAPGETSYQDNLKKALAQILP